MPTNVLILGAGASRHHDFPVAAEIWERICVAKSELGGESLKALGFPQADFDDFAERMRKSHVTSVDLFAAYIQDDPAELYMAKGLIAFCLGIYEIPGALTSIKINNWYRTLSDALIGRELRDFPRHDIELITFNYERSLERYLLDCLVGRFGKRHKVDEIKAAFLRLRITHIYGQMGALPELAKDAEPTREYQQIRDRLQMDAAVSGMHLLPEIERNPLLGNQQLARECLGAATGNVTFLGFSYGTENLKALDLSNTHTGKQFYGTMFEVQSPASDRINERMQGIGVQWHPGGPHMNAYSYLAAIPQNILGPVIVR